jgi:hypothetical protein
VTVVVSEAMLTGMEETSIRRITAVAGLLVGVTGLASVPLYFVYSGPPPAWNVETRDLINIVTCVAFLTFLPGLRHRLRDAGEWAITLLHGTGLVIVALILVGVSLEGGSVIANTGPAIDPTTDGPLAHGDILIHGSIGRAVTVVFLATAGYAIRRSGALPWALGVAAYVVAAVNAAFIPSIYFGPSAARFYSALGWGNTAATASLLAYWVFAVGVVLIRRPAPVTAGPMLSGRT